MEQAEPITMVEARRIALAVLAQAEQERRYFADEEARRGIDAQVDRYVPTNTSESN